ncbi:phosphoserine aminotransferase [Paenibacillus cellulosilyticus]|uniref:Phosphoserine aminotransferase n=1 Tax=Paenibacillus cellulosilyticus TaxID=375489 RepID=A0A2V2YXZ2_9BACL|nr:3-phosphoserine/phosphohydroxythreonine transaminase [Paenibacillus cellulosilyticus]PWW07128.1 phosphoserine aminotransferase [Paenibacillus cellulosilyticus]QKS44661.1 3-phosphoserine/phosphohydroxythreonine transaminase [Paenibacillus cellulosilyticus]
MTTRLYNFNPGPAALPLEVLEEAKESTVQYGGRGISIMEMSHRSKPVEQLAAASEQLLLELTGLQQKDYRVLFMGGGASTQFAMLPSNFLSEGAVADYILSGSFSEKALQEAQYIGETRIAASSKAEHWQRTPDVRGLKVQANTAYVHMTTNNTIEGSRFNAFPETGETPLIVDMTSDLLSRDIDYNQFSMIYAGAQKNIGPAGITAVIIRNEMLDRCSKQIPLIWRYATYASNDSLYNTPPVHALYLTNLVLQWTKRQGGVQQLEAINRDKAALIYEAIDRSGGFYEGIIATTDRSDMNITWRLASKELEQLFVQESEQQGFEGLAGHRSVGGIRASAYNAVPRTACQALVEFMVDFQRRKG